MLKARRGVKVMEDWGSLSKFDKSFLELKADTLSTFLGCDRCFQIQL